MLLVVAITLSCAVPETRSMVTNYGEGRVTCNPYSEGWAAIGVVFALTAAVGWFTPAIALDHYLSNDSVDCTGGCGEIRWNEYSKYDGARGFAKDTWNAVGHISLGPDDATSAADLEFRDYSDCSSNADYGTWEPRIGSDRIRLNECLLDPLGGFDRDAILVHELGHALRLANHPGSYWQTRSIMFTDPPITGFRTPRTHDEGDYHDQW